MKSVSVTEFKAHCLEFLNQVAKTGQSLLLTKRGKPIATVSPASPATDEKRWKLGQFEGTVTIVGDIIGPLDVEWEALS